MEKQDPNSWEILVGFGGGTSVDFARLSGGVMVAQGPLEAFVMVRIHAGQPLKPQQNQCISREYECFEVADIAEAPEKNATALPP